jgi:hypothetical protein
MCGQANCCIPYSTIGGGVINAICSCSSYAAICHTFIGGGCKNQIFTNCGVGGDPPTERPVIYSSIGGGQLNIIQSYIPAGKSAAVCFAFIGGGYNNNILRAPRQNAIFGGSNNVIESSVSFSAVLGGFALSATASCYSYANYLSKTSGKFSIRHPDPSKKHTHNLVHSFVESPTAGDNIYRYEVTTQNCEASVSLPDYYKFLNCNDQVWITPKNHMGVAYGDVNAQQTEINIKSNCDGSYYVLLIGTRKDDAAQNRWKGVEQERIICRTNC